MMTQLPSYLSLKLNSSQNFDNSSSLDDSGLVPPSSPHIMLEILIFHNDVLLVLPDLNPQKVYKPDGVACIVREKCTPLLVSCLTKLFQPLSIEFYLPFLIDLWLHLACF